MTFPPRSVNDRTAHERAANDTERGNLRFSSEDLRNTATPAAVERVWSRLEDATLGRRQLRSAPRGLWAWSLAGSTLTFVFGLWIGSGMHQQSADRVRTSAEPTSLPAAGPARSDVKLDVLSTSSPAIAQPVTSETKLVPAAPRRPLVAGVEVVSELERIGVPPVVEAAELSPVSLVAESVQPPVWQRLANGGEYEAALFELAQTGGFEQAIGRASAEQLMLLFDIARATAQHQRALAALRRIVGEYPGDPVAPLAAWSLANLLEKLGDAEGARKAFSTYRSLSPTGEFAEDALVRQLKNAISAGDSTAAKRLVAQYRVDFPEGRRRAEVARWAAHNETTGLVADSGVPETADFEDEPESAPAPSEIQSTP